jgi:hypothetical protein
MIDRAINLVSVLSVVGSLIFVGLELRQSQQIALASQVQARTDQALMRNLNYLEGEWELGYKISTTPYENLSDAEKWARDQVFGWQRIMQQNNYFMYRTGLLDIEQWLVISERIKEQWNNCSIRHTYDFTQLEPSYTAYLSSLEDSCA